MKTHTPFETTTGAVFFGTLLFGIGAFGEQFWAQPAIISITFWGGILYLGIFVTFVAFLFYFIAINNIGATQSSIFTNLVPIFGTFFSWLILKETIHWTFLIGLFLIVVGIFIINFPSETCIEDEMVDKSMTKLENSSI